MHVGRFVVGIALMVAAVFLQICLVKYKQNFKALMLEMVNKVLPDNVPGLPFDFSEYVDTANSYVKNVFNDYFDAPESEEDDDDDNQPPKQLNMDYEIVREFRPPHLEFRVGDVILTHNMIVGAVVGWSIDMADLSKEPEYYLLIENTDWFIKETQNHIIQVENVKIEHKDIKYYFASYDGVRYIPKRWLAKLYPKD